MNISPAPRPGPMIKTDRAKAAVGVRMGLNLVHIFAHLAWPVMPEMAQKIHEAIASIHARNIGYEAERRRSPGDVRCRRWRRKLDPARSAASRSIRPMCCVAKITEEQVAEWKAAASAAAPRAA